MPACAPKDALRQKLGWLVNWCDLTAYFDCLFERLEKSKKKSFLKSRKRKLRGGTRTK